MGVSALRIVIAGADPLVRAGLRALVSALAGVKVVGEVALDRDDGALPMSSPPDVIVCDVARGAGGVGRRIAELDALGIPVLALVPDAARGRAALAAGAQGFLFRDAGGDRIAAALHAVAAGLQVTDASGRLPDEHAARTADVVFEDLTPRELDVLRLLAEGLPNKAIARRLEISEHTVKFYVTAIMGKLGAHSRTETVARAARAGLIVL